MQLKAIEATCLVVLESSNDRARRFQSRSCRSYRPRPLRIQRAHQSMRGMRLLCAQSSSGRTTRRSTLIHPVAMTEDSARLEYPTPPIHGVPPLAMRPRVAFASPRKTYVMYLSPVTFRGFAVRQHGLPLHCDVDLGDLLDSADLIPLCESCRIRVKRWLCSERRMTISLQIGSSAVKQDPSGLNSSTNSRLHLGSNTDKR